MHPTSFRNTLKKTLSAAAALALLVLVVSVACGSSDGSDEAEPRGDYALVWEAWEQIDQSYPGREDLEALVGRTLESLLELAGAPAYPFLYELGRLRGQPPSKVPPEMTEVWRALVLHQSMWPNISEAELMEAAISGMLRGLEDEDALVWEAWDQIDRSYASREDLDVEAVVGSTLASLLELADGAGYPFLAEVGRQRGQAPSQVPPELADVWRALLLHKDRWPEIGQAELIEAAISGMVRGLEEPSTVYFTSQGYAEARESLEGNLEGTYLGIGASVVEQDGQVLLFPFNGEPADKAGVENSDALVEVDGIPVAGLGIQQIVDMVAGLPGTEAGSKVSLLLKRDAEPEALVIDVFRNEVDLLSVDFQLLRGGIGYIRIISFRENTADRLYAALEEFNRFETLALIVDLRANPGGSLEAAHAVAGHFLPPGTLFISQQKGAGSLEKLKVVADPDRPALSDPELVVLINDQTVGEAEAVAAALQDADRAVILGTSSYGKGSGNEFLELTDGSAIYLPTSRWFRLSGQPIAGKGVEPDMFVTGQDAQVGRAYEYLDQLLPAFR